MSGGQLALVMAEVTTTNPCGQNTDHVVKAASMGMVLYGQQHPEYYTTNTGALGNCIYGVHKAVYAFITGNITSLKQKMLRATFFQS